MFLTEKTSNRHSFRKFNLVFCMVLIDSSKPRKVFYQAIELLKKASLKWPFDQELKKEIELLGSISFKKNVSSHNRRSNGTQSIILLDSELFRSVDDLKSELHSTIANLKETNSYNKEQESFSKKEILFLDLFLLLTCISFCNLTFAFLLWKRK
ncbi:hypothetical protein LEP1GSC021_5057 [Leptospira noguchii str. 1993005606]|nr:hypothetical protein LEP1GSC035_4684 [Leptospira noguchii str. 2007001578]EPE84902.1 hypothetical protein LEP1GSC021_5057 [Leptospira noguchii str. 1993005606]